MKKIILLLLILSFSTIYSQSFLQTVDGRKFEYEKINFRKDLISIENRKEKTEFNPSEVFGYYSFNDNTFYYRKNNDNNLIKIYQGSTLKLNLDVTKAYFFIERVVEGKIKLYRKEIITESFPGNYRKNIYWYIEKEGEFYKVHTKGNILTDNKRKFEELLNQVLDETDLSNNIRNKDYKHKIKDIIEIVKLYNLNVHSKNRHELSNTEKNKVVIYRDSKNQIKEKLIFTIDSTEYYLNKNDKLELDLPISRETLVCIKNDSNRTCELILAHDHFITYYEINLSKKRVGSVLRKNGNSSYTKARLNYINKKYKK